MLSLVNSLWNCVWSCILHVITFFFRFSVEKKMENLSESDDHGVKNVEEVVKDESFDQIEEKGEVLNANTSKYQFYGGKSVCAFIEQPQTSMNFTVHEMFVFSDDGFVPKHDLVEKVCSFSEGEKRGFSSVDMSVSNDGLKPKQDLVEKGDYFLEGEIRGFTFDMDVNSVSNDEFKLKESLVEKVDCFPEGGSRGFTFDMDVDSVSNDGFKPKEELVEKVDYFPEGEIRGLTFDMNIDSGSGDGFKPKQDLVEKVCSFDEGENQGFIVEPPFVKSVVCDGMSREDGVLHVEIENSVGGSRSDDLELVQNGEEEVVGLGKSDNSVSRCQNDGESAIEQSITEKIDYNSRCEPIITENIGVLDINCCEKDASSISQDELSEKEETVSLDEIVEKDEVTDQVHSSIAESDDFWSAIYKDDCAFGNHDEIMVDYEEYCEKSLDDSSIDQNNLSSDDVSVESDHVDDDSSFIELEPHSSPVHTKEHILGDELSDFDNEGDHESLILNLSEGIDSLESCDEADVQMGNDVLLEQKELIRQMKKEMRQLKVNGLPTILEESESPRVEDDLRPLRIDEKMGHKDRMNEIDVFYRRYLDKMRKLDILSQQTMYGIGLLQLKNQDQLALNQKVSIPLMKSLLAQNFWSHKLRKHEADSVHKVIRDLKRELELVYVGQLCLSWEMLKWQHHKVEELHAHDPDGFRQYNQVAGEFQKFQVLLQRFIEDEPFHQGPRVQHYLKTRCGHLNLLQVPLIKEDPRSEWKGDREGTISISMLKEVIGSSMRSFWDFLHAEKDEAHTISLMGIHGGHVDLQDPSDTDLLTEIRSGLHKKEKRLKDLVRSGNCLVRKFQKHHEQRLSPEMFLAQVELRLVSRVLNMSKLTTDQLLWCHKKTIKTNIIGRKVYIESSFLLFPC